ncbi:nitronate monooxygenase [Mycolicibacterium thermoresistibile]|nr:nitronate monooxygenase [Mycolicibacterium thermoresistibile]MCV7190600.1 nitronate monooxygenase [Mycolicibacterium thermoresistibile]GAT14397.1 2-nitropropane dioxygenase [Mycolicibacterium thermoresistibile]SNW19434.1 2-nitropropane dioxygenase-like enzyme [Mycolicibacterium thermoresistibile]
MTDSPTRSSGAGPLSGARSGSGARFDLRDLRHPIVVAPMAGGPSTPELAAAGSETGGLGFLAAGYLSAATLADRITAARRLTTGPIGVNLFTPQPDTAFTAELERYAQHLAGEAERYGVALGEPRFDDDDWAAKLDVVADLRPEVVSFTFGLPSAHECARLRDVGITTIATVTTVAEAEAAEACGVDAVVAQAAAAGGHRGTFDPTVLPADQPLLDLVAAVSARLSIPVVAAGGLVTAAGVAGAISAGAVAVQAGTAFLLADEAGTGPTQRAALRDPQFTETALTRAFSGRYARGLRNRFIDEHEDAAPFGYPQVHHLTSPVRAAAARAGDPHGTNVWAGTGYRSITAGPAADILTGLAAELPARS